MGVLFLLGFLVPPAAAQTTASAAEDAAVLREAKAAADTSVCTRPYWMDSGACPLDTTWTPHTAPCGDGWDRYESGWVGVRCDAPSGRVLNVFVDATGVGGELLPFFGRLGALLVLWLDNNPALRGDVADLAGATELRYLSLADCPLVVGEMLALATLIHLGEVYTTPCSCTTTQDEDCSWCNGGQWTGTGHLYLAGTGVHGPVAALRAVPGLGDPWGGIHLDFSPCSAFGGQQASEGNDYTWGTGSPGCAEAGLEPVENAADHAGIEVCACCGSGAPRGHDESGACCPASGCPSTVKLSGGICRSVAAWALCAALAAHMGV